MRLLTPAAVLAVAGIGALFVAGTTATVVAIVLLGTSVVLLVAAVFLEVGLSEDRARERERRRPRR